MRHKEFSLTKLISDPDQIQEEMSLLDGMLW